MNSYYVKTFFSLSKNYLKKSGINRTIQNILFNYAQGTNNIYIEKINSEILYTADRSINKCITEDYNKKKEGKNLLDFTEQNNFLPGVFKAYIKAVVQIYLFVNTGKTEYSKLAKEYLYKANEIRFPKEMERNSKIFILEKIALLNMIEMKYEAAIKTLESLYQRNKYFPIFAAHTLALANILNKNNDKAMEIIQKFLPNANEIFIRKFEKLKRLILGEEKESLNAEKIEELADI